MKHSTGDRTPTGNGHVHPIFGSCLAMASGDVLARVRKQSQLDAEPVQVGRDLREASNARRFGECRHGNTGSCDYCLETL